LQIISPACRIEVKLVDACKPYVSIKNVQFLKGCVAAIGNVFSSETHIQEDQVNPFEHIRALNIDGSASLQDNIVQLQIVVGVASPVDFFECLEDTLADGQHRKFAHLILLVDAVEITAILWHYYVVVAAYGLAMVHHLRHGIAFYVFHCGYLFLE
jgi:hypothetical protein